VIVLSADQQKLIARLSAQSDWPRFVSLIAESKQREIDNLLRSTNPVSVHQQQGYCQALVDILQAIEPANPSPSGYLA
jgi:hypothetical protein